MMGQNAKVFVAGHRGMVGGALVRRLEAESCEILTAARSDLDLMRQSSVDRYVTYPNLLRASGWEVQFALAKDWIAAETPKVD